MVKYKAAQMHSGRKIHAVRKRDTPKLESLRVECLGWTPEQEEEEWL